METRCESFHPVLFRCCSWFNILVSAPGYDIGRMRLPPVTKGAGLHDIPAVNRQSTDPRHSRVTTKPFHHRGHERKNRARRETLPQMVQNIYHILRSGSTHPCLASGEFSFSRE